MADIYNLGIEETRKFLELFEYAESIGWDYDSEESMSELIISAQEYILEETSDDDVEFIQVDFHTGRSQNYFFAGLDNFIEIETSGDIFDFTAHYTDKDRKLFKLDNGNFIPVSWYEIPKFGEDDRSDYIFVFDKVVLSMLCMTFLNRVVIY